MAPGSFFLFMEESMAENGEATGIGFGGTEIEVKVVPTGWGPMYATRSSVVQVGDAVQRQNEAYTLHLNQNASFEAKDIAANIVADALSDNSLDHLSHSQKQTHLTDIANNTIVNVQSYTQKQLIDNPTNLDTSVVKYSPVYDYSQELKANVLQQDTYDNLSEVSPSLAKIDSVTRIDNATGITKELTNRELAGKIVDPYKNINNPNGLGVGSFETIGGADLTCFIVMEIIPEDQYKYAPELQKKEMIIIEMDSVISLSYSTLRERFPVRVIGQSNPKANTAGIRTIAGHIAFAVFTEDVLSRLRSRVKDEIDIVDNVIKNSSSSITTVEQFKDMDSRTAVWNQERKNYASFAEDNLGNTIQLLDSLPLFHILVMGVNEAGTFSQFMIKNVSIIDENQLQGTQQPNIINKVSYVATDIVPMHKVGNSSSRVATVSASSIDESFSKGQYNGTINYNSEITGSTLLDSVMSNMGQ